MPEEWKRAVKARLKERRLSQAWLSGELGTTPGNVSRCLKPASQGGYRNSSFAPRIAELVGVPLPGLHDENVRPASEILAEIRLLSPSAYGAAEADLRARLDQLRQLATPKRRR